MMRRIAIIVAALAALAGRTDAGERPAPSAPKPLPVGEYIGDPTWVRTPTSAELAALYPEEARKARNGASVLADCVISATGALNDCRVDGEAPSGQVFASATLQALKLFEMSPTTRDGRPVAGLRIALNLWWEPPSNRASEPKFVTLEISATPRSIPGGPSEAPVSGPVVIMGGYGVWAHLPTANDIAELYPDAARADRTNGEAVIQCTATRTGALGDCLVLREAPSGEGFGKATLQAATRHFVLRPTLADGRSVEGAIVIIPFRWQLQ